MRPFVCRLTVLAVLAAAGCGGGNSGVEKPANPAPKPESKSSVS